MSFLKSLSVFNALPESSLLMVESYLPPLVFMIRPNVGCTDCYESATSGNAKCCRAHSNATGRLISMDRRAYVLAMRARGNGRCIMPTPIPKSFRAKDFEECPCIGCSIYEMSARRREQRAAKS
jgi:hypothetical protein